MAYLFALGAMTGQEPAFAERTLSIEIDIMSPDWRLDHATCHRNFCRFTFINPAFTARTAQLSVSRWTVPCTWRYLSEYGPTTRG